MLNISFYGPALAIGSGICAVLIPYTKKDWFESAPAIVRSKVGNVPVLSIVGGITAVGMAIFTMAVILFPQIGYPVTAENLEFVGAWFVLGMIIYYIALTLRKRQGIDIRLAFVQLPPE